ncbi:ABC transporter substrate-binding protein [bacterium]|nr:ABC transporter substrate-binding protein [bacterium]
MKKWFTKVAMAVAVTLTAVFAAFLVGCQNKNKNEFVIGVSGPLTGPAAVYGLAVKNSAQMAVDEINEAGGLGGYKFKFVAVDDKHDASTVSTNYATLVKEGMQVSLGCVTTKPGLEFKSLSKEDNVFFMTPSATADNIPEFANGYQMCFADTKQGTYSANYVNDNVTTSNNKIGVLYRAGDDYSQGIYNNFKNQLAPKFTLVEASFTDDNPTDLSSQVELLKDCEFIFLPIYYTPASVFMLQAKDKVSADCVYFGCDGLDGIESSEGFDINSIPQEVSYLSHFNSNATEGAAKTYIDKYVAKYGKDTLNQFGASAYDCVYAIYNAMKAAYDKDNSKVTPNTSASDMCEVLKTEFQGGFSYSGVTGTNITWDRDGYVNKAAVKYVVKAKSN